MNALNGSALVPGTARMWEATQRHPTATPTYGIRNGLVYEQGVVVGRMLSVEFVGDGTVTVQRTSPRYSVAEGIIYRDATAIGRVLSVRFDGAGNVTASRSSPAYGVSDGIVYRDGSAVGRQLAVVFNGDGTLTVENPAKTPHARNIFEPGVHDPDHEVFL